MNRNNSNGDSNFVEYNDENLEHVMGGPDYGQPEDLESPNSCSWDEIHSNQYPDFVSEIKKKILKTRVKLTSEKF